MATYKCHKSVNAQLQFIQDDWQLQTQGYISLNDKRCNLLTASKTQCCFGCSRILWSCAGTSRLQSKYCRTRTIKNVKWIVNRKACPRSPNSFTNCVSPPSRHAIFFPSCVGLYFEKPFRKSCHIVISLIAILVDFQTAAHTGAPWRLRGE